jgi:CDGSH-type Zn-finger protein/mannose-6-phosphate isomerase-like protein (cupin superfamily)
MSEAVMASRKPFLVELQAGRRYAWCACGRSRRQPFCDGSHAGTGIEPVQFVATADREAVLCGCKRTGRAPFCDGSHNALADKYEEAGADEIEAAAGIPVTPRSGGRIGKSGLDGGCFVSSVDPSALQSRGTVRLGPVIGVADGAQFLSQWYMIAEPGLSGVLSFPGSDTVLFLPAGEMILTISGRSFAAGPENGIFVRNGEAFQIRNSGTTPLKLLLTVCPRREVAHWLDAMPDNFDAEVPERVFGVDASRREPMADRFYQVLNGEQNGCREVTQFIGEVPRSRAAAHRHLYEEAIMILAGEGYMWTEAARATVGPGDIIFLPRKQLHSLECTTAGGMRLMGAFYPAGSPAVNY